MAKILLVNFNEEQGSRLAAFLGTQRHKAWVGSFSAEHCVSEIDLVIVDASQREKSALELVTEIAGYRTQYGPRPLVLCLSRVYRGPQFELEIERKGVRFLYV